MYKHDFDLCRTNCKECNGINIMPLGEDELFICEESEKILAKIDDTTLIEYGTDEYFNLKS